MNSCSYCAWGFIENTNDVNILAYLKQYKLNASFETLQVN